VSEHSDHFVPGAGAFFGYVVTFVIRYVTICGGMFYFFNVMRKMRNYKIQQHDPPVRTVLHEILWSGSNTICTGLFTLLMYWAIQDGHTKMYFTLDEKGWLWLLVSPILGTLGFDTWFYWQHRLLHTRWFFRHAHAVHHRITNPTPFAAFAHHPIETFFEDTYFLLFIMVVPVHPLAFAAMGFHAFVLGIAGHMGFEFFPRGFTRHWLFGLHNTSTHHNMHHSQPFGNYGLYFNYWDQLMGTNHPTYHEYFDRVKERQMQPAPEAAE
jgi:sterol desaturase/sphingolipid hydroxylase (fatty acid hydroxylase superfamily)